MPFTAASTAVWAAGESDTNLLCGENQWSYHPPLSSTKFKDTQVYCVALRNPVSSKSQTVNSKAVKDGKPTVSKPSEWASSILCSLSAVSWSSRYRHVCRPSTLVSLQLLRSVAGSVLYGPPRLRRCLAERVFEEGNTSVDCLLQMWLKCRLPAWFQEI